MCTGFGLCPGITPPEWISIFFSHPGLSSVLPSLDSLILSHILCALDIALHVDEVNSFSGATLAAAAVTIVCGVDVSGICIGKYSSFLIIFFSSCGRLIKLVIG